MAKILLADDEQFIAIAYSDGLKRAGHEVSVAHDGAEALEKIKAEKPDVVLLDLIMPKLNGFEVLKKIKADDDLKHIHVVILSNLSQHTDEEEARKTGAADFWVKADHSLKEVVELVDKLVAN